MLTRVGSNWSPSYITTEHIKWYSHFGIQFGAFLETTHNLPIESSKYTPWYFTKELKIYVYIKTCTKMLIAALFRVKDT